MSAFKDNDPRIHGIKTRIRVVPNFPKPAPLRWLFLSVKRLDIDYRKKDEKKCFSVKRMVCPLLDYDHEPCMKTSDQYLAQLCSVPQQSIMFQDITTLLLDPSAFKDTIDLFVERYKGRNISVVAGVEARGFIFGPPIALAIGAKFVPLRKPGKLPGELISEKYVLEYGSDCLQMHVGAVEPDDRALVVDDLVATGGTLCAAINLLERVGAQVVECACVIELPDLKGRERLNGKPLYVLVESH